MHKSKQKEEEKMSEESRGFSLGPWTGQPSSRVEIKATGF